MSHFNEPPPLLPFAAAVRQRSSENNSVSSSSNDWDMANDVFVSCYDEDPLADGEADAVAAPPGLDRRHLPLTRADPQRDGILLGLVEGQFPGYLDLDVDLDAVVDAVDVDVGSGVAAVKKRNRSNSSRHRGEVVTDLGPEEVRWFYKEDKRTWKPFVGHDSLKIEVVFQRHRELNPHEVRRRVPSDPDSQQGQQDPVETHAENAAAAEELAAALERSGSVSDERHEDGKGGGNVNVEAVCVRGGLYEVDVKEKECYPVYWNRKHLLRCVCV